MRVDLIDGEIGPHIRSRTDQLILVALITALFGSLAWNMFRKTETGLTNQLETMWIDATRDQDREVRIKAVTCLGELNGQSDPALKAVGNALSDYDPSVRRAAITAIANGGTPAKEFIPALMRLSKDDQDRDLRDLAGVSVSRLREAPDSSKLGTWLLLLGLASAVGVATYFWMHKTVKQVVIPKRKPVLGGL